MSYLVLARKYRPQLFKEITGQEHVSLALANAIKLERVPHALIFSGPRGVGKTTAARVFAKALNCQNRDPETSEPCGKCVNCQEITRSSSISVWEIDGASNNSVDNVRSLIESLQAAPPPGSLWKIYIIDEVHMLSVAAFNALLKSLEEPPPNTIFIFATTEPHKIPDTVTSRCQVFEFRRLSDEVVSNQLKLLCESEGLEIESGVLRLIVSRAAGGMRDAQSMLDRLISISSGKIGMSEAQLAFGAVDRGFYGELGEQILSGKVEECLSSLDRVFHHSLDIKYFLDEFVAFWRGLLLVASGGERLRESTGFDEAEIGKALSLTSGKEDLFNFNRLFQIAEEVASKALRSEYPRYVIEAGVVRMASLPDLRPLAHLLTQSGNRNETSSGGAQVSGSASSGKALTKKSAKPIASNESSEPSSLEEKVSSSLETSEAVATSTTVNSSFNPSWTEFVSFVAERREMVLAAYLRRVSMEAFSGNCLSIVGSEFDVGALKSEGTLKTLKSSLEAYSGQANWVVKFGLVSSSPEEDVSAKKVSSRKSEKTIEADKISDSLGATRPVSRELNSQSSETSDSISSKEKKKQEKKLKAIEKEARESSVVKAALEEFSGSKVEKVIVSEI